MGARARIVSRASAILASCLSYVARQARASASVSAFSGTASRRAGAPLLVLDLRRDPIPSASALVIAAKIEDEKWRACFLEAVPENAETLALARAWRAT